MLSKYLFIIAVAAPFGVLAESPAALQAALAREAQAADSGFVGFSAARGAAFFGSRHGGDWSCASCHTEIPCRRAAMP